jgi:hypothetical protein
MMAKVISAQALKLWDFRSKYTTPKKDFFMFSSNFSKEFFSVSAFKLKFISDFPSFIIFYYKEKSKEYKYHI